MNLLPSRLRLPRAFFRRSFARAESAPPPVRRETADVVAGWLGVPPVQSDEAARKRLGATQRTGAAAAVVLAGVTCGQPIPLPIVVVAGLVAMVVVVGSWLILGTVAHAVPLRRLRTIAVWWSLPLALGRPLFSGDLWSYQAQGLIPLAGHDPYRLGPARALEADSAVAQHVSHYWVDTPAPYGPAWEGLATLVGRATGTNLVAGVLMYRTLALAGILLIAWALPRLVQRTGTSQSTALWLCLLNPLVLWHLVSGAHNDAIMLGLMFAGFELGLGGRSRRGTSGVPRLAGGFALLILSANVKIVAIGAVCCLAAYAARRHGRVVLVTAVVAAGGVVLSTVVALGSGLGFGWIGALGSSTSVYSWMAPTNQLGFLIGGVAGLFGWHVLPQAVHVATLLGAAVGAVLGGRVLLSVYRGAVEPVRGLALLLTIMVVCGPVVQPWYLLWAILPLAMSARLPQQRNRLVIFSAVIALALPPTGSSAPTLIIGYAIAAAVAAGVWWRLRAAQLARAERAEPCNGATTGELDRVRDIATSQVTSGP